MQNPDNAAICVYNIAGELLGKLTFEDGHEVWPEGVHGWTHALDCRIEPYSERPLAQNISFAKHVHKQVVVMHEQSQE